MQKFVNLTKNNKFQLFILFLIIILGFYLRIIGLNKPAGLWYDEVWSYYEANQSFPFGILNTIFTKDIHAPLYFVILHFWIKLSGHNDTLLRFLSVIFGTLTIPAIYLAGKELSGKKIGFIAATLVSINSLLIYYSQEVRFYSFLVLLCSLSVLFLAKIKNNPTKLNYIGLIIFNLAIIHTFTIGFVFVFLEVLCFLLYLYFKNKEQLKSFILAQIITFILCMPFMFIVIHYVNLLKGTFTRVFDVNLLSYASILTVIQNWFSPVVGNFLNVLPDKYESIFANGIDYYFVIFAVIPVIISIFGIINAILKRNFVSNIILIGLFFIFVELVATLFGKFTILTRYTIIALPIFIIAVSYGLSELNNKFLSNSLISALIFINLFYLFSNPLSASKHPRPEGFNTVANILNKFPFTHDDFIFMPIGSEFLNQYYSVNKAQILTLKFQNLSTDQKFSLLVGNKLKGKITEKNSYNMLKEYIKSPIPSKSYENYLEKTYFNSLKKDRYFIIVISRNFCPYYDDTFKEVTQNDDLYKKQPLSLMISSKIANDTVKISRFHLPIIANVNAEAWDIYVFQKKSRT